MSARTLQKQDDWTYHHEFRTSCDGTFRESPKRRGKEGKTSASGHEDDEEDCVNPQCSDDKEQI